MACVIGMYPALEPVRILVVETLLDDHTHVGFDIQFFTAT